jgi:hypothetical protein
MTLPIRAPVSARRFSPEHQSRAARARHSRTEQERRIFERWLEQAWNNGKLTYDDVRRFVSVIRRLIHRGDFAARYTVTPNTLCDWLRCWRKAQHQSKWRSDVCTLARREAA